MATASKVPARFITFDENGDTLIILPQSSPHQQAADQQTPRAPFSPLSQGAVANESSPKHEENDQPADITSEREEVHMKVSKKHLVLASSRARTVLQGPWQESDRDPTDGLHHWSFEPVFTLEAFEIVMRIIHGQTKQIPHIINLKRLADIAAVVDDLRCEEAVWFFAKSWIDQLREPLPTEVNDDLARWIMVASAFDEPDIFEHCTRLAILHSRKPLDTAGLPIRPPIIDSVEAKRTATLDAVLAHLKLQRDRLSRGETFCTFECRSALLGALLQGMHSSGVLPVSAPYVSPEPRTPPHLALSVSSAIQAILNIQSPVIYCAVHVINPSNDKHFWKLWGHSRRSQAPEPSVSQAVSTNPKEERPPPASLRIHGCSLKTILEPQLTDFEKGMVGLKLGKFVQE